MGGAGEEKRDDVSNQLVYPTKVSVKAWTFIPG